MPQLDIYRGFDEISLVLLVLFTMYLYYVSIVLPLKIQRMSIIKIQIQQRLQGIEKLITYQSRITLAYIEKNYKLKL